MLSKNILYIKKGNRETIVTSIKGIIVFNKTIEQLLNDECLKTLSTYKGRIDAIKQVYGLRKNIPIYINNKCILFPTTNKKDLDNIYINACQIISIESGANNTTIITFKNNEKIILHKGIQSVKRYYKRSIMMIEMQRF